MRQLMLMSIPTLRPMIDWNTYNLKLSYSRKCINKRAVIFLEEGF